MHSVRKDMKVAEPGTKGGAEENRSRGEHPRQERMSKRASLETQLGRKVTVMFLMKNEI